MVMLVKANQKLFTQLGKIIELPIDKSYEQDYARMLQYIAMKQKYQGLYIQFLRLWEVMTEWRRFYSILKDIRIHYPSNEFDLPSEFKTPIPGVEIFQKYDRTRSYS